MHHDRTTTSHPCWPALLVAALLGYAVRAAVERSLVRQLAAARAEAAHDPLTGLPNRRAAVSEVNTRLAAGPFLFALLDLDDFKSVNDTFGHPTGDDLLAVVAARLYIAVPPDGFVARLAGDEFLILLPDHGGDPADAISPVLTLLAEPARLGAATLRPRASAGVATTASGAASWRQLIARADLALYRAKHTGDGVAVYHPHHDVSSSDDGSRRPRERRRDHHQSTTATGPDAETGA